MAPTLKTPQPAAKVSKRRAKPPKKSSAKRTGKTEEPDKSRKRSAPQNSDQDKRHSKASKIVQANTSKRIGTSSAVINDNKAPTPVPEIVIYNISSDDDEALKPDKKTKAKAEPTIVGRARKTVFATMASTPHTVLQHTDQLTWALPKVDSPSDSEDDLQPGLSGDLTVTIKKEDMAKELQDAKQELIAAKESIRKLRQESLKSRNNQDRLSKAEQDLAKLASEVEAERRAAQIVIQERDQLRNQLQQAIRAKEKSRKDLEELQKKPAEDRLRVELQQVRSQYEKEAQGRKEDAKTHAEILDNILKSQPAAECDTKVEILKTENARLVQELETLKAAATTLRSTISPVPSSVYSDEDKKEENVRKMFVATKRKYDILVSVAAELITYTRSMDLSCFGDFGKEIKRLRKALESTDKSQSDPRARLMRKAHDDDEDDQSESQRSRN